MSLKNYFALLNLPVNAGPEQVRAAMKKAAQQGLLDLDTLREIRDVLFDNQKRPIYMRLLREQHPELFQAKPAATPPTPPQAHAQTARAAQPAAASAAKPPPVHARSATRAPDARVSAAAPQQASRTRPASAKSSEGANAAARRASDAKRSRAARGTLGARVRELAQAVSARLPQPASGGSGGSLLEHKENRTLLVLLLIGAAAVLFPWLRVPQGLEYQNFYGWNLDWTFFAWFTVPLFLLCAAQVWMDQQGAVRHLAHFAILPAVALGIGIQALLRLGSGYNGIPGEALRTGTGLYLSLMMSASVLVYIGLIAYKRR